MRKQIKILVLLLLCSTRMSAQQLAVGTDVALDLFMTPNIGAELVVGDRTSVALNVFGNYKPWGLDAKMMGIQPEYRYWIGARPMHKVFIGAGAIAASYDMTWKGKIYDGTAYGAGLTFGYVFNLTDRLNVEAHAGCGLIGYTHKEFFVKDNYDDYTQDGAVVTNASGYTILPTRIGVSITYIFR